MKYKHNLNHVCFSTATLANTRCCLIQTHLNSMTIENVKQRKNASASFCYYASAKRDFD